MKSAIIGLLYWAMVITAIILLDRWHYRRSTRKDKEDDK